MWFLRRRGFATEPDVHHRATEEIKKVVAQAHVPYFNVKMQMRSRCWGTFFMCTHTYEITISTVIASHNELQPTCFMEFSMNRQD